MAAETYAKMRNCLFPRYMYHSYNIDNIYTQNIFQEYVPYNLFV